MKSIGRVRFSAVRLPLLATCLAALLSGGCSGARIDSLEKSLTDDIKDLRSLQAESTAQLTEIRSELRTLAGKVEELEYAQKGKAKQLEQSLRQLGSRVPPPSGVPEDLLTADEERIASLRGDAAEIFKLALSQLRTGDFDGARQNFSQFVTENPGTAFTDNGLFWLGIVYSKIGQNDRAVVSFSEVFQQYPAEDMVPPALYYLGETFAKAGSREDAVLTLQKLIDEHPRSPFAAKARTRIQQLKRRR